MNNTDPVALVNSIKAAWEQYKAENDRHLADIRKGQEDIVRAEKIDRINQSISDMQSQLGDLATKAAAFELNGGSSGSDDQVQASIFGRERGLAITREEFKAYKDGLNVYMRRGQATPTSVMAALSVGSGPDGAYAVTPDMSGRMISRIYETSPMRQIATVEGIGTNVYEGPNDLNEIDAGWVSEKGARVETSTPELGTWSIPVHEMYAEPKATQTALDDMDYNVENWLMTKASDKFARVENKAFISGDGIKKARGILTYSTVATADSTRPWEKFQHIATGVSGGFHASVPGDTIVDTVFSLKSAYRSNAVWLMNKLTVGAIRKLKDGNGNYLWQPDFTQRQGGTLAGYPIVEAEDMPDIAANSLSIGFGDFKQAYIIVDRKGISLLRDPYSGKPYVKFYMTKRVGGGAVNFDAVKFMKFSAS